MPLIKPIVNKFSQRGFYKELVNKGSELRIEKRDINTKNLVSSLAIQRGGVREYKVHNCAHIGKTNVKSVPLKVIFRPDEREYFVRNDGTKGYHLQKKIFYMKNVLFDWCAEQYNKAGEVIKRIVKHHDSPGMSKTKPFIAKIPEQRERRFLIKPQSKAAKQATSKIKSTQ